MPKGISMIGIIGKKREAESITGLLEARTKEA